MAYAEIPDVRARLGRLRDAITASSQPDEADVSRFLDDRSNLLDAFLSQFSSTPLADGPAQLALRPMVAVGAALDAIDAAWPGGAGAPEVATQLRSRLASTWDAAYETVLNGTHPAVIVAKGGDATPNATALWTSEPTLGMYYPWSVDPVDQNPELAPRWSRLTKF